MKKTFCIITVIVACVCLSFALTGCSIIRPDAPSNIVIAGNYITWDSISDSATYTIYEGETEIGTTESTFYKLPEEACSKNTEYSLMAKGLLKGSRSKPVIRYKNTNFTADEEQIVNLSSVSSLEVPATTLKLALSGSGNGVNIVVAARTTPLLIELNDANLVGMSDSHAITMASADIQSSGAKTTIIINSIGTSNSISAGSITNIPSKASAGKNGATGSAGKNGVLSNNVIVCGNAPLSIVGGTGGKGGTGGDSQGASVTGNGGSGGIGGSAIQCNSLYVAMDDTASLTLQGGAGGAGGTQGSNNSVMSGLWNNILDTDGHPGGYGQKAANLTGTVKEISGAYVG